MLAGTTTPGFRTYSINAAANQAIRIPNIYGDANNRVTVSVDGTSAEVKINCIGM
jgi:hypothetical protein